MAGGVSFAVPRLTRTSRLRRIVAVLPRGERQRRRFAVAFPSLCSIGQDSSVQVIVEPTAILDRTPTKAIAPCKDRLDTLVAEIQRDDGVAMVLPADVSAGEPS